MQIVVLGMHRSGTSAVSRLINMMGANAGRAEKIGKPAADNSKGFWEHSEVRDLNDQILACVRSSWDDISHADLGEIERSQRSELTRLVGDFVFEMDTVRPWVIKDPRLSITLPLWQEVLECPLYVIPYRHPEAVAASLYVRNRIPEPVGMALWEEYLHRAIKSTEHGPRLFVSYEQLVVDSSGVASTMFDWLVDNGATGLRMPSDVEVRGFVSSGLQHHVSSQSGVRCSGAARVLLESLDAGGCGTPDWSPSDSSMQLLQWLHENRLQQHPSLSDPGHFRSQPQADAGRDAGEGRRDVESDASVIAGGSGQARAPRPSVFQQIELLKREIGELSYQRDNLLEQVRMVDRKNDQLQALNHGLQQANGVLASTISEEMPRIGRLIAERGDADVSVLLSRQEQNNNGLLRQCVSELSQMRDELSMSTRSIAEMSALLAALRQSMRWRIGNVACGIVENLLLRGRPKLAIDRLEQLAAGYDGLSTRGRRAAGPLIDHLHSVLGINHVAGGAATETVLHRQARVRPQAGCMDVIFFPVIDWHFRVQRPQHLARELGALGHRVFYLETVIGTGSGQPGFEVLESPAENVFLIRLHTRLSKAPNIYKDVLSDVGNKEVRDALSAFVLNLGVDSPAAIIDLPFWSPLAKSISGSVMVYDCMDHHAGFSTNDDKMLCLEEQLIQDADVVVVTSDWLEREVGKKRAVSLIRNGAQVTRFSEPVDVSEMASSTRPRVGYIGAISDWFDIGLLTTVAKNMLDVDFVLVGDVTQVDVSVAASLPNVEFIGEVPYEMAPQYVQSFDVCTIPFRICELTLATNPVKAYEYLAAGKPVVATPLPELERMDDMVSIAADAVSFEAALRAALDEDKVGLIAERQRWVAGHDWSQRAGDLARIIDARFPRTSIVVLTWNNLDFTRACLASIEANTRYPNVELVLVDNGSSDETPEFLRAYAKSRNNVKVILNEENLGFAAGNNAGLREATGEYVVVLNNDTYVTPGWLQGLVGHLMRNPDIGIVGPVTNNIGNEARIDIHYRNMGEMLEAAAEYTRRNPRVLVDTEVVAFFCCAFRRQLLDEVGFLDEQFGRGFFEDDDYCRRVSGHGLRVAIAEDVFVHHHLSASFNEMDQEERSNLFDENKRKFEKKWGAWAPHEYRNPDQ